MGNGIRRFYEFGPYRIDPSRDVLLRADESIPLTAKAFQTLLVLVENSDQVMSKERLMEMLWPDTFVEESNLAKHISMVRKALGQTAQDRGYIITVPGKGYRFAESVRVVPKDKPATVESDGPPIAPVEVDAGQSSRRKLWKTAFVVAVMLVSGAITYRLNRRAAVPLTEKDTAVLGEFVNSTTEPVFDGALRQALSVSLNQSPFLNVMSENKVDATLRMMARPVGKPLSPDLARELCQRAGSKVYITGSIATLGTQYVVGLKAINCANGDTLAQEQATATAKEKVLDALGVAAAKLRTELGESLATVQKFDVPLQQATTPSLEALRSYSLARREAGEQGPRVALPYDQKAIQLDPAFAMGYFAVGYDYFTLGEVGRASEYFTKAFELGSQVSEREKLTIAAAYYQSVTGELDKAEQTYRGQIASYPRDARAYLDLAVVYGQQGQYGAAADAARRAVQLAPDDAGSYGVLSYDLIALQRLDEARQTIQQAAARKLDDLVARQVLYALAFLKDDRSAMQEQAAWFTGKAAVENAGLSLEADTEAYSGHLRSARELTARAVESALRNGHKESAAIWLSNAALREAAFGNGGESRRVAGEAQKLLPTGQAVEVEAALALAMVGDAKRAASMAADLNDRLPTDTQTQSLWLPTIQSRLALDRKDPAAALNQLRAAASMDVASVQFLANISCLNPVYERGEDYLEAGDGAAAAAEFQKILDHSGIVWNCWTGALARLGVARANALQSRTARGQEADAARTRAVAAYGEFLNLWKDADPDVPILKQAQAEFAKLQ
jgi:eukaryotic-like serine/threonine-protein kinase